MNKSIYVACYVICLSALPGIAATRYTDDNGTLISTGCTTRIVGTGACTAAYAMSQMVGGDTLIFLDGTYNVAFGVGGVAVPPSGSSGAPTILKAENQLGATIRPTSGQLVGGFGIFTISGGRNWITWDGLVLWAPDPQDSEGIYVTVVPSNNLVFKNGECRGARNCLQSNIDTSDTMLVQKSIFHDNGATSCSGFPDGCGGGMYWIGHNLTVEDSKFYNNFRYHIETNYVNHSTGWMIRRNEFYGNWSGTQDAVYVNQSSATWHSNIFHDNPGGSALLVYGGTACEYGCKIYHNTIVSSGSYCIAIDSGNSFGIVDIRNNICYANGSGAINTGGASGTYTCSNNLNVTGSTCGSAQGNVNPFVNAAAGDFHITANDNGGIDLSASISPNTDFDGVTRLNPPDRGAYEFIGTAVTTRYADDDGTDTTHATCTAVQTGSSACTFAHAAAVMSPGDTLILADGTYNNTCVLCVPSGTSTSLRTTIRAANARQVTFNPTSTPGEAVFELSGRSNIVIDGIVADCGNGPTACGPYDAYPNAATNVIIRNGEAKNGKGIYGSGVFGIFITSLIANNLIHDNGQCPGNETLSHGVYISGNSHDTVIEGNDIYNNICAFGVTIYNGSGDVQNNIVRNNKIRDNLFALDLGAYGSETGNTAYNNLIYGNNRGIEIGGVGATAYHNTIYANDGYCFVVNPTGTNVQIRNNICLSNGNGGVLDQGAGSACSNNLNLTGCGLTQGSANPFVNASSFDFHLTADDNGGIFIPSVTADYDNFSRGNPPDRGAFDFRGSGVTAGASIFFGRLIR